MIDVIAVYATAATTATATASIAATAIAAELVLAHQLQATKVAMGSSKRNRGFAATILRTNIQTAVKVEQGV